MSPHPPSVLRERLAFFRRAGLPFDEAWRVALYTGRRTDGGAGFRWWNGQHKQEWSAAFEATKDEWRRAFEGESAALDRSFGVMEGVRIAA